MWRADSKRKLILNINGRRRMESILKAENHIESKGRSEMWKADSKRKFILNVNGRRSEQSILEAEIHIEV